MKRNHPVRIRQARRLRHRQTDVERLLWSRLRARRLRGQKFRRQHPIGHYIVDFCCPDTGLVIELDGGQHAVQQQADVLRSRTLERQGYHVLRFWNNEVLENIDAVLTCISGYLDHPHPGPLPARERGK